MKTHFVLSHAKLQNRVETVSKNMFKSQIKGKSHVNPMAKKNGILKKIQLLNLLESCNYFN